MCQRTGHSDPTSTFYKEVHLGQILNLSEPQFHMDKPGIRKKKNYHAWVTDSLY